MIEDGNHDLEGVIYGDGIDLLIRFWDEDGNWKARLVLDSFNPIGEFRTPEKAFENLISLLKRSAMVKNRKLFKLENNGEEDKNVSSSDEKDGSAA